MGYELIEVTAPEDWRAFHQIRRQELFEARGRGSIYNDKHPDDFAPDNHPLLLKLDGRPLGVTRLDIRGGGSAIFRLVAVTAMEQGKGHGRVLDAMTVQLARGFDTSIMQVNAALTAVGFYRSVGWSEYLWDADEQAQAGVACVQMRKFI